MSNTIETQRLCFEYNSHQILNNIDLQIPSGAIYGYLGKNGAGKSTTIRLLLGLLQPSSGSISFFGKDLKTSRTDILARIGNLIENPTYYPYFSAYENLKYLALCRKCSEKDIADVMHLVGLSRTGNKKLKFFSMGMKQRLGIAIALLHSPDILILDEPLNGLDAEGIYEMRELLILLQNQGKTIFLSSHILSEIEKVCSHVGILDNGIIRFQGRINELLKHIDNQVIVTINDPQRAVDLCIQNSFGVNEMKNNSLVINIKDDREHSELIKLLCNGGVDIFSVKPVDASLETVFLNLTKKIANE